MNLPKTHRACSRMVLVLLAALVGCGGGNGGAGSAMRPALPTAVHCSDAAQLRKQADADRRGALELTSEQDKMSAGNRALFFASLAVMADLTCKPSLFDTDAALKPALDAARRADAAQSFYERAGAWSDANFLAVEAIGRLTQQRPAPPSTLPHE